jgi:hypothetical protein
MASTDSILSGTGFAVVAESPECPLGMELSFALPCVLLRIAALRAEFIWIGFVFSD